MNGNKKEITYKDAGVDYDAMDPFKRACQTAGLELAHLMERRGAQEIPWSRGESVYLFRLKVRTLETILAFLVEGLGTKNRVAEILRLALGISGEVGQSFFAKIAIDTIAMHVNDMITLGALPITMGMHCAVGNGEVFEDEAGMADFIEGWKKGCEQAGCGWGCGETPTLRNIIMPETMGLSGACVGIVSSEDELMAPHFIEPGDAIVVARSSGIHANVLTLAQRLAHRAPKGYASVLSDGRTYGEALLDPTIIYVPWLEECFKRGAHPHYGVNITGHGWRKLMRAKQPLTYRIETLPSPHPVFEFVQRQANLSDGNAYGDLNMGGGFAFYAAPKDVDNILLAADSVEISAFLAGWVEEGPRRVILEPIGVTFDADSLGVR